jgi:hypothetical protein
VAGRAPHRQAKPGPQCVPRWNLGTRTLALERSSPSRSQAPAWHWKEALPRMVHWEGAPATTQSCRGRTGSWRRDCFAFRLAMNFAQCPVALAPASGSPRNGRTSPIALRCSGAVRFVRLCYDGTRADRLVFPLTNGESPRIEMSCRPRLAREGRGPITTRGGYCPNRERCLHFLTRLPQVMCYHPRAASSRPGADSV